MADMMTFPDTMEEFMEQYKIVDTDGIYMSKGAELVPIFRMKQWFEHLPSAQPPRPSGEWIEDGHHIQCDKCGMYMCNTDKEGDTIPRNFCPNCGADMRGEQK